MQAPDYNQRAHERYFTTPSNAAPIDCTSLPRPELEDSARCAVRTDLRTRSLIDQKT
jgi:hypothetical protein